MEIRVNGTLRPFAGGSVAELLVELSLDARLCAVERNKQVVPKSQQASVDVQPGDEFEIVTLAGGG